MFTRILAVLAVVFVFITGFALAGSDAKSKSCCDQKLACCKDGSKCCSHEDKAGCCDKGLKCCAEDKACCQSAPKCCQDGDQCCDEAKVCCDKKAAEVTTAAVVPSCCQKSSNAKCCPADVDQG